MNKIQKDFNRIPNISHDTTLVNCYGILEKHCIGFAEWLGDKRFNRNTWFDETNHCMDMVTTQELFNEYINQL